MKNKLQEMTWKEIEEALAGDPVVILPLGSMEQHGPHSITGDYLAAEEAARIAAERTGSFCAPVIPFGYSEYFRCYPGTISLSQRTLYSLLTDVCESLLEHGVTKLAFFNGHGGNSGIVEGVARDILRERGIVTGSIDIWRAISPETKERLYGEKTALLGHGGDPVTSVMLWLKPEVMRMDLLGEPAVEAVWEGFAIGRNLNSRLGGCEATMYFDMDTVTKDGMQGDPRLASREAGELLFREIVDNCTAFVEGLKRSGTVLERRQR